MLLRYLGFNPLHWIRRAQQMRRFVRSSGPVSETCSPHLAVVVTPWLGTAVPWFSIALGIILAADGARVSMILDGMPFGEYRLRHRFILACIRYVLRVLPRRIEVLELPANSNPALVAADLAMVGRLAGLNAVWQLRGEMRRSGRVRFTELVHRQLERSTSAIRGFLSGRSFDCVLVPGGVYGSSGVWTEVARAAGVRIASFDSGGRGVMTVATNGIACQLQDIPRAFALLKAELKTEGDWSFVRETALAELQRRRSGKDRFASQLQKTHALDPRCEGAVLLALNSSWDSAALGLHAVFESSAQWIVQSVQCLLEATDVRVIIRQHPAERFDSGRSSDDYRDLLQERFGDNPRILFIGAEDPVNSYELLDLVSVVVVYTSTIGVEAALKGKVVITPSRSYYSRLGFVRHAVAIDQYKQQLIDAVRGRYSVSDQNKADAITCYYLTQCCNWVSSPLSPEGFEDWIGMPFGDLIVQDGVRIASKALREDVPTSFLMHLAKVREQQQPAAA
jgi:hypothetical protein